jgi:Nif-specific regulatory protein
MEEKALIFNSVLHFQKRIKKIKTESFEGSINDLYQSYLHYRALYELVQNIAAETEIEPILEKLLDSLNRILQSERSLVLLFDRNGDIAFQKGRNLDNDDVAHPAFEVSWDIINKVRGTKMCICLPNALENPDFQSKSVLRYKILSVICIPIHFHNETIGILYLDNRKVTGIFRIDQCSIADQALSIIVANLYNRLQNIELEKRLSLLHSNTSDYASIDGIIGHDPKLFKIMQLVEQVSNSSATVLIEGASGTGKELVAQAIHRRSGRRLKKFISLNCAALAENLLESELFGHVKGAFTGAFADKKGWFETADGGTIFFDEISEMSQGLQAKLLRVLQSGEFVPVGSEKVKNCDVRIIAATNKHLLQQVQDGEFRNDLYYRLNIITLELPNLVDRQKDILLLAYHFINKFKDDNKKKIELSVEAQNMLQSYDYPGNIRELENIIQRALLLCNENRIMPNHLPPQLHKLKNLPIDTKDGFASHKKKVVENFEKEYIIAVLQETEGIVARAAKIAQMDAKNFYQKMNKYNINASQFKQIPQIK